jgi:hypothetical protein
MLLRVLAKILRCHVGLRNVGAHCAARVMPEYDLRFPSDNQPLQASQVSQRFTTPVSEAAALQALGSSSGALPIKARHDDAASARDVLLRNHNT